MKAERSDFSSLTASISGSKWIARSTSSILEEVLGQSDCRGGRKEAASFFLFAWSPQLASVSTIAKGADTAGVVTGECLSEGSY